MVSPALILRNGGHICWYMECQLITKCIFLHRHPTHFPPLHAIVICLFPPTHLLPFFLSPSRMLSWSDGRLFPCHFERAGRGHLLHFNCYFINMRLNKLRFSLNPDWVWGGTTESVKGSDEVSLIDEIRLESTLLSSHMSHVQATKCNASNQKCITNGINKIYTECMEVWWIVRFKYTYIISILL